MGKAIRHYLVTVEGEGFKYTNPGGFVLRGGEEYVLARRNSSTDNMATDDAARSSIVLLKRTGSHALVDENVVLLQGNNRTGYEDPRLLPINISIKDQAFTYTYVDEKNHYSCLKCLRKGRAAGFSKVMGPPAAPCKNGFLFKTEDGGVIVVSRPDNGPIRFYRLASVSEVLSSFNTDPPMDWWNKKLSAEIKLPTWARGEQGAGFSHIGFGTTIGSRSAIIHFGHSDDRGKYYATALQRLDADGSPVGPPEIIAEPAKNLPVGDVPNVIYTTMAWVEGKELVMWSGHDDTYIVETRMRSPL
jgi:predicted GH43/DUF377 family glycosyl hydrolase